MPRNKTPLREAQEILTKALKGSTPLLPSTPRPFPTGSRALDRLIGGPEGICDGYPSASVVQVCIPKEHFNAIREIFLRTYPGHATLVRSSDQVQGLLNFKEAPPLKEAASPANDLNVKFSQLWEALYQKTAPEVLVVDDVLWGSPDPAVEVTWTLFLPRAKTRMHKTRHTILAFAETSPMTHDAGPYFAVTGGRVWGFYSSLRLFVRPSNLTSDALAVTLWKNKVSPTQGTSTLLAVREGRIDDEATAGLLSSTLKLYSMDSDAVFLEALKGVPLPEPLEEFPDIEELLSSK